MSGTPNISNMSDTSTMSVMKRVGLEEEIDAAILLGEAANLLLTYGSPAFGRLAEVIANGLRVLLPENPAGDLALAEALLAQGRNFDRGTSERFTLLRRAQAAAESAADRPRHINATLCRMHFLCGEIARELDDDDDAAREYARAIRVGMWEDGPRTRLSELRAKDPRAVDRAIRHILPTDPTSNPTREP